MGRGALRVGIGPVRGGRHFAPRHGPVRQFCWPAAGGVKAGPCPARGTALGAARGAAGQALAGGGCLLHPQSRTAAAPFAENDRVRSLLCSDIPPRFGYTRRHLEGAATGSA